MYSIPFKRWAVLGMMFLLFNSCEKITDEENDMENTDGTGGGNGGTGGTGGGGSGASAGSYGGYWARNDGQVATYVYLNGSVAQTCNAGTITTGTFNASDPSMTFVINGTTLKIPLQLSNGSLLVGVPNQYLETHNATPYKKVTTWACSGGGGGTGGGTTPPKTGKYTFYTNDSKMGNITVTVNGQTKSTNGGSWYPQLPPCGTGTNAANFELPVGAYNYTATGANRTWSGSINVTANSCKLVTFTGTSGSARTGQVMFFTGVDMKCGAITVTCGGSSKTISGYYSGGTPSCGASATATFSLNPGKYAFSAKCSSKSWSGTITVTADNCASMRLTN